MNNLLIDIGNSDVKIGTALPSEELVNSVYRFSYSKQKFEIDFRKNLNEQKLKNNFGKIGISVLNDKNKEWLSSFLKDKYDIKPVFVSRKLKLPVKIDYSAGLGNDRICSASAASLIFKNKNILVIDFGTATTYTLIVNKIIKGGLISPGIKTSLRTFIEKTSLPEVSPEFPEHLFNTNTEDNIKAGVLYSALYSCERIINEAKKKYGKFFVIATGGYSNLVSEKTKSINKIDENLVLKGINFIISK